MTIRAKAPDGGDIIMTPAEVAHWLQVEERQLARFGAPAVKLGQKTVRYIKADVLSWLASQRKAG